jgi:hypothetical protein
MGRPPLPAIPPRRPTWADVDALTAALSDRHRGFAVRFKDESRSQRGLAWLLRPVNPRYATHYTTVLFGRIYFPSRQGYEAADPAAIYATLRHEAVHLEDMRRFPVLFELSYLLLLPAGLTMRAFWELRAYRESMRVLHVTGATISDAYIEDLVARFAGLEYFYMCPIRALVRARLLVWRARLAQTGPG